MSKDFENFYQAVDAQIASGDLLLADQQLQNFVGKNLSSVNKQKKWRQHLYQVGSLYRRLGKFDKALRLLKPYVRSEQVLNFATPAEQLEYAANLVQIGAHKEGLQILLSIPAQDLPQVWFFSAISYITQWQYQKAIEPLQLYLNHPTVHPYQKLVAKTNLAACLVFLEDLSATDIIQNNLSILQQSPYQLLLSNNLLLQAQVAIFQKKYQQALVCLQNSQRILKAQDQDLFLLKKWNFILKLQQASNANIFITDYKNIRSEALTLKNWESVRDIDYYWALQNQNESLLEYVFVGTPNLSYRERLLQKSKYILLRDRAIYQFCDRKISKSSSLKLHDLSNPLFLKNHYCKNIHRLLISLAGDFYRPKKTNDLFLDVFPNEYFDSARASVLVRQLILRTRQFLQEHRLPLSIESINEFYVLRYTGANQRVFIQKDDYLNLKNFNTDQWSFQLWSQQMPFTKNGLRASDIAKNLGCSVRQAQFWIQKHLNLGHLQVVGSGPQTRYKISTDIGAMLSI